MEVWKRDVQMEEERRFRPWVVIKRENSLVNLVSGYWLCSLCRLAWLYCSHRVIGELCVCICVCMFLCGKVQQHCRKLPCRLLAVVCSMKGASLFFSCLLPVIRVCTASKMAGVSGNCVCVLACLLYVIMCACSLGAKAVCTHCSGIAFPLDTPLRQHFLFINTRIASPKHKTAALFPLFSFLSISSLSMQSLSSTFNMPASPFFNSSLCLVGAYQYRSRFPCFTRAVKVFAFQMRNVLVWHANYWMWIMHL